MNQELFPKIRQLRFPWFTFNLALFCIILWIAIGTLSGFGKVSQDLYTTFGAPYSTDIYSGQYWGVISNSFIHVLWYHLAINILGLFLFGAFAERRMTLLQYFLFGLSASFVSSAFQLTFSNDAGIGLSGVNYAFFGFIFVKSKTDSDFHVKLKYVMFMIMMIILLICFYMNYLDNWNIGLIAMISGFFWGLLIGMYAEYKTKLFTGTALVAIFLFCVSSLFYAPWSAEWQVFKGISAHGSGETDDAMIFYEKALELQPEHPVAAENLRLIHIDQLSEKAYNAHLKGEYSIARKYYLEILRIDKENRWARENLSELP